MKNNIDWYKHNVGSHNHPKFKALRAKYKWEGEGKFWALNNMIAASENCQLDISKGYNLLSIASDLDFTPEAFTEFITYLSEACQLITYEQGVITTGITQECLQAVQTDREKARKRWKKKAGKNETSPEDGKTSPEVSEPSTEVVHKRRVEEIREDKSRVLPPFYPPQGDGSREEKSQAKKPDKKSKEKSSAKKEKFDLSFIPENFRPVYDRWLEYRRSIRKNFKNQKTLEANFRYLVSLSNKDPALAEEIVQQSINNEYQGLFPIKNFKNGATNKQNTNLRPTGKPVPTGVQDYGNP